MKKISILSSIFALFIFASSCKKEGQTINNYNIDNSSSNPNRKMIASYGAIDNSYSFSMSFKNNEIGKMEEAIQIVSGIPYLKVVYIYNTDGKLTNYQVYSLPSNSLTNQGLMVTDNKKRITKIVGLDLNSDTNVIYSFTYNDKDYQSNYFSSYKKSNDRIELYTYFTYDKNGNVTKAISYKNNGTDPLYKSEEIEASYSDISNPINQMYYFNLLLGDPSVQSPNNFSNYFPTSVKSQTFNKLGTSTGINIKPYTFEIDKDNNITTINNEFLITYK